MKQRFIRAALVWILGFAPGQATSTALASPPQETAIERADDVLARARKIYGEQGPREALPEFERALKFYRASGDRRGEAITIGLMGNCYKHLGDPARAEELLQRALSLKREIGDRPEEGRTLSHLGLLYKNQSEFPKAIEAYQRAIAIGVELSDRLLEGSARNNLALVYDELGDYRRSLEEYNRALELYRGTGFERGISDTIGNLGGWHLLLGRYSDALPYYLEALSISERINNKEGMTLDLINLGLCYLGLGQVDEALRRFDRAIQLAREGEFQLEEADALKGKGTALLQMGKYDAALQHFQQSLAAYEKGGFRQQLTEALGEYGALHLFLGDIASAEKDFRRAIDVSRSLGHARGVTLNLIALGNIELRRRRLEEAVALYREALARAEEVKDQFSLANARIQLALAYADLNRLEAAATEAEAASKIARGAGARLLEARAEYARGEAARKSARHADALQNFAAGEEILASSPDPELAWRIGFARGQTLETTEKNEEAITAYQRAIETIEDVRNQLREERYRSGYLEDKYQVYVALVQLLLKLERKDEAFVYSEKLRAMRFLDLLSRGAPSIRNETQRRQEVALRERIRILRREMEAETAKPVPEQKRQALDLFSAELNEAERAYQALLDDLLRTDAAYAGTRAAAVPPSSEVQKQLPEDVALVEYVLGENQGAVFVLRRDELKAQALPYGTKALQGPVDLLRGLIARERGNDWRLPAANLHRSLITPLEKEGWLDGVKRLYLVPHGILHYVPFAALPQSAAKASPLLIDRYEITYLPAAAVLVYGNGKRAAPGSVLAVAPQRTKLQFAREEARRVAATFAGPKEILLGAQATESAFKSLAGRFGVLHLATHGFFNKMNPLLSGVELEPGADEDGRLEVHEILSLRLHANLVALSACETGLGSGYFVESPAGDDLVGLTRAFLYAGSPSVLATLWEVNDRSTLSLMEGFYQRLGKGGKAGALAAAQRAMKRRSGSYAHPYYWSAFVLVGQMN